MRTDRTARNAAIVDAYLAGATLQSIGEQHGLTRERVRQICKASGRVPSWTGALRQQTYSRSEACREALRSRQSLCVDQRRLKAETRWAVIGPQIKSMVEAGYSARDISEALGLTRNAVIGLCHRFDVTLAGRPLSATARMRQALSAQMSWEANRAERIDAIRRAMAKPETRARMSASQRARRSASSA